jgi:hypothetical protein
MNLTQLTIEEFTIMLPEAGRELRENFLEEQL